ncbi:class I SAM-dependent RNA methyltransferase [bacterium]|nr:class I SAM-dependent RNA methyltransferase [bacterium]
MELFSIFVICPPGLETVLQQELIALGIGLENIRPETGGLSFQGDWDTVIRCNLSLRTANRLLVRLGAFYASGFPELKRKAGRLPWNRFLPQNNSLSFSVTSKKSRLIHKGAIEQRLREVISEMPITGSDRCPDTAPSQIIFVRIHRDFVTISLDTSGELLYKRGYRLSGTKAPIRETLAAGMIALSGWNRFSPLMDPFCGSGTIPIEAMLMAANKAAGLNRSFAFENWCDFSKQKYDSICRELDLKITELHPVVVGSDRDAGSVQSAIANAERAGTNRILFCRRSISEIEPSTPETGWIVTNPPYGRRLHDPHDLRNLYARFGRVLKERFKGWNITLICPDPNLVRQMDLQLMNGPILDNGGLRVRAYSAVVQ